MHVHLIDGTYELFRHYYALPHAPNDAGQEVAATRGVVTSVLGLLEAGATHVAVATDHVIESFRNALWPGYKDGSGIEPDLVSQFGLVEDALRALGVVVRPMIEHEADDALATGAAMARADPRVVRVFICTPDKDLAQCVEGDRIVQFDRRGRRIIDESGVIEKFGVGPASIPDYLALVGDSADGFPGIKGWGAKSSAAVLARYAHLEQIPRSARAWDLDVRGADRLAAALANQWEDALLFRGLATLKRNAALDSAVDDWAWTGPADDFPEWCTVIGAADLVDRADRLRRG